MTAHRTDRTSTLEALHNLNQRLAELMPRLEQANHSFAEAARPLHTLRELNEDQKNQIGGRLRAAERELEEVTELIRQAHAFARTGGLRPTEDSISQQS